MRDALAAVLRACPSPAIAVSGGVDSMTLAALAADTVADILVVHAISPAVPHDATARVRRFADARRWPLLVIDAGEFEDPRYRANPVNRCFYCKTNLYGTIRRRTSRQIFSGANLDDLREYRPGLIAADEHGVRHPFVEAGFDKRAVRELARELALDDVADLPASPCLSSRVETGLRIEAATLTFIHAVEGAIARELRPSTVRCRVRAAAVVIELDGETLRRLDSEDTVRLAALIDARTDRPAALPIRFAEYRNGSAFLTDGEP